MAERAYLSFTLVFLITLLACASAAKKTRWHELEARNYDHEQYIAEYGKTYATTEEHQMRKTIFERNLKEIKEHNRKGLSWKSGVNHLTDRTEAELKRIRGYHKGIGYASLARNAAPLHQLTGLDVPPSVDYRKVPGALTAVKDQGNCGSCWAFSTAETIESQWFLQTGMNMDISVQQIAACTSNPDLCGGPGGCNGGTQEVAFQSIMKNGGITSEYMYPYTIYNNGSAQCIFKNNQTVGAVVQIHSYRRIPTNNYDALLDAVANIGPIAIGVDASRWYLYESGIFDGCNQTYPSMDHAVQAVGYGTEAGVPYWIVRNSWSPMWGDNGYIRLYRDSPARCGVDIDPQDGDGCHGGPPNVTACGTCGILLDCSYPILA